MILFLDNVMRVYMTQVTTMVLLESTLNFQTSTNFRPKTVLCIFFNLLYCVQLRGYIRVLKTLNYRL